MQSFGIKILWFLPVVLAGGYINKNSVSSNFHGVLSKPSDNHKFLVVNGKNHLRYCLQECMTTDGCLVTVFDSALNECHMFNSTTLVNSLDGQQKAALLDAKSVVRIGE